MKCLRVPHSQTIIWLHTVWSTKERRPIILPTFEKYLYHLMRAEFENAGCVVRVINGTCDHVHCLFRLSPQIALSGIIKQVKGCSSHEINARNLMPEKFAWQTGYAAFSLGHSAVDRVSSYIANQKSHHLTRSLDEEYSFLDRAK